MGGVLRRLLSSATRWVFYCVLIDTCSPSGVIDTDRTCEGTLNYLSDLTICHRRRLNYLSPLSLSNSVVPMASLYIKLGPRSFVTIKTSIRNSPWEQNSSTFFNSNRHEPVENQCVSTDFVHPDRAFARRDQHLTTFSTIYPYLVLSYRLSYYNYDYRHTNPYYYSYRPYIIIESNHRTHLSPPWQ